jgi:hypothetical protein
MGGGASFLRKKKPKIVTDKDPIRKSHELLASVSAKERLITAMKLFPPTTFNRWEKVLVMINRREEATEDNPDPLRIEITFNELKITLKKLYDDVKFISSDGLSLCRTYLPKIYYEHRFNDIQMLSKIERNRRYFFDSCYNYGEIDYEIFSTIYLKCISVYGNKENGIFYDLGCGIGNLVYTSACIGNFERVVGIETLNCLFERCERRQARWNTYKTSFTNKIQETIIEFYEDDFIKNSGFWIKDGSFYFLHWTTFSLPLREKVTELLAQCQEGSHVITFTKPIEHELFVVLLSDTCDTSWGKAEFFFHEKVSRPLQ